MNKMQTEISKEIPSQYNVEKKVDLDTILVEELGQFGLYQAKTLALALIAIVFNSWVANEYIFTTARINSRCFIPECERESQSEFVPSWILNAIPGESSTSFADCDRYAPISSNITFSEECPANLFDTNRVIRCNEYFYENSYTIVYKFNLACDEWRRSIIGTIMLSGTLIGLPLSGFISDRWGRRTSLTFNTFNAGWVGLCRSFTNTYGAFVSLEVLELCLAAGGFSAAYILVIELVGQKYRVMAATIMNTFFALGQVFLGLIAWGIPYWRHLTLVLYSPMLLTISYLWIMPESVRWYMSKGLYQKSEKVLKDVSRVNRRILSENSLKGLRLSAEEERLKKFEEKDKTWLPKLVFQHKPVLLRCIISPIWWMTTTFIYYGMSVNAVTMTGNPFLNYVAVAAVEIPGFWTSYILVKNIGRKPVLTAGFWICGLCQIAYIFISKDYYAISLTVYLIGKFSIAMVMTAIYIYTSEIYPTIYRHQLMSFSSVIGRIGALLAPLTPALSNAWTPLPSILFAGMSILSGSLMFLTPETLGSKLPDTMEEASNIGKKNTK